MFATETKDCLGKPYHFYESLSYSRKEICFRTCVYLAFFPHYPVCGNVESKAATLRKQFLYATFYVFNEA